MLHTVFGESQPQTLEEIKTCVEERGWNPAASVIEIYHSVDQGESRKHLEGWIAQIWGDDGEMISTCGFPDLGLLQDGLTALGFKEIEVAESSNQEAAE